MKNILKRLLGFKALRRSMSVLVLALSDGGALILGLAGASWVSGDGPAYPSPAPLLVGLWTVVFAAFRLYDRAPVRRNPGALVGAASCWAGLTLLGAAVYPESGLTLASVLVSASLAFFCAGALRFLFEWGVARVYRRGFGQTPVLVAGREPDRARVLRTMERADGAYVLAGEVGLEGGAADLAALRAALDETDARIVVLAGAERLPDDELLELLRSMRLRGVPLRVAPGALALMRGRTILSEGMGMPLLEVRYPQLDNSQRALKRALDIAVSLAGILLLWPLFLVAALAVRLDSPGPVLFRQKRVGADEKTFICLMLRTMRADAEVLQEELEAMNEARGPIFKIKRDPRVTRVGNFLRRWSLDELPQLVNVLRGEMSLVGPRPLPVRDFLRMEEAHKRRLGAVPGMTGYWQISGRSDLSFEDMVRLDLFYIENWSLSFDLKIILKTLGAVLRRDGAY